MEIKKTPARLEKKEVVEIPQIFYFYVIFIALFIIAILFIIMEVQCIKGGI